MKQDSRFKNEQIRTNSAAIPESYLLNHKSLEKDRVFLPSPLTFIEKLELLYLTPYYLQAAFFIIGTICWLIAETVFRVRLPFWTEVWGWSLVLTNLFALPLMNLVGLFMEESEEKDYAGLLSFIALSYILAPFQAYAAIKGFMEDTEGPWFRTPKTGRITDIFVPGRFSRIFSGLFGENPKTAFSIANNNLNAAKSYINLAAAQNKFNNLSMQRKQKRRIANIALVLVLTVSTILMSLMPYVAIKDTAYANSFSIAYSTRTPQNSDLMKIDNSKAEPLTQPVLKRTKSAGGNLDFIFQNEPRVRGLINNHELDLSLSTINGKMLQRNKSYRRDDSFIYPDVIKAVDARIRYQGLGYTSELKLKKYTDIQNVEYRIRTNLEAKLIGGEVVFSNSRKENEEVFKIGLPYMYEENNPRKVSNDIFYKLTKTFDGWILTKVLTNEARVWLAASERMYPVILDPTVNGVIQTAIDNTTDSRWESPARKVAYMPNATGGAAWYATHTDGGAVFLEKCLVSAGCESTSDWSNVSTNLDTSESDTDNRNSTVWKHGDVLYIAWFDNNQDKYQFTTINTTSSDSQGSVCSGADKGSAIDVYLSIAVASDGDVYIGMTERGTGDGASDLEGQSRIASGGCTETDIQTGSNIDQNDSVEVLTIGDNAFFIFVDNVSLKLSVYVDDASPGWDTADLDVNGASADNSITDVSAVTDGTDIWVFQRNGTTGDSDLYKCTSCPTTSQTFTALTDPWSAGDHTAVDTVGLAYLSSANEIMAVMLDNQTGTGNYHIRSKKSNADSISWQSEFEFDIGSQNIDIDHLTMTAVVPTSDQAAVVYQDNTNSEFEFSTVPENIYLLLVFLPLFIYLRNRKQKGQNGKLSRPRIIG